MQLWTLVHDFNAIQSFIWTTITPVETGKQAMKN